MQSSYQKSLQVIIDEELQGDKILLPQSCSEVVFNQAEIFYPICFELSIPPTREEVLNARIDGRPLPRGRKFTCGVREFIAIEDTCSLPPFICQNLSISQGDIVKVNLARVPKGNEVTFEPSRPLPSINVAKAKLEVFLRNFTCLNLNSIIPAPCLHPDMSLKVQGLGPADQVHIMDADLALAFVGDNAFEPMDMEPAQKLSMGKSVSGHIEEGGYMQFSIDISDKVIISLLPSTDAAYLQSNHPGLTSDVDLYASFQPNPTKESHQWSSTLVGENRIDIDHSGEEKTLWLSVHGFSESLFTLRVYKADSEVGRNLAASPAHTPASGQVQCELCKKNVPEFAYRRHLHHCKQQNWYCEVCGEVMKHEEQEKHEFMRHRMIFCDCGVQVFGDINLTHHKQNDCILREVKCKYCNIGYRADKIEEHELSCGSRTEKCPVCDQYIPLSEIRAHCLTHGFEYSPEQLQALEVQKQQEEASRKLAEQMMQEEIQNQKKHETRHRWEPKLKKQTDIKKKKKHKWVCKNCDTLNRATTGMCWKCKAPRYGKS